MLPDIFKVAAALFCLLATVMLLRRQWADMEPAARSKSQQIFFRATAASLVLGGALIFAFYALTRH